MFGSISLLAAVLSVAMIVPNVNASFARAAEEPCVSVPWPGSSPQPAEFAQLLHCRIASHDGVKLDGWIGLPRLEPGSRAPVTLHSTPYIHSEIHPYFGPRRTPEDPLWWSDTPPDLPLEMWGVPPIDLVRNGYAAAFFSVRGSGRSGGCFDMFGLDEQLDQVELVDWLAAQPWSNGNVGMAGFSYPGATPLEAAIHRPEGLKTIVVAGIVSDAYQLLFTPQGAASTVVAALPQDRSNNNVDPSITLAELAEVAPERLCPEVARVLTSYKRAYVSPDREAAFWEERRLIDGFPEVTAAVLLAQGFHDLATGAGHLFQESAVWETLDQAPKRQIQGQWGHTFPYPNPEPEGEMQWFRDQPLNADWTHNEWHEVVFAWLGYWLKGEGSAPRLGFADYQDNKGNWHESRAWPPSQARTEVLHLSGDELTRASAWGARSFLSAPYYPNSYWGATTFNVEKNYLPSAPYAALCSDTVFGAPPTAGLAYRSKPVEEPVTIAGNPFASLKLTADQPGGLVTLTVLDVGPEFECDELGEPTDVRVLSMGAADLRFNEGNYVGRNFPMGQPTHVRVDLSDIAEVLEPGHQLALTVSYGETHVQYSSAHPFFPNVRVMSGGEDGSQLVMPVVGGTLGGKKPQTEYLPRPFIPA